ncbi:putative O-glycosylation ligase, exosortase A system-associated [Methyloversatilis thermotolerans]|uniref:putative O-glycosylation ligase, exosortase A system-associated n=1 Tax=Methyloversatilis thermotolerans TaxID=1346290 RepID=UPI000378C6B3|nr:putative O-glycosylation ligase, exosortase A system-associated [Methyloversatilis thermotolerans]
MRDLLISAIVFGALPLIFRSPWLGIIMFTWLSLMNPHRLAYGFSLNFPFAMIVALTTLVGLLASKEPKKMIWSRETRLLIAFILWMCLTTVFAMYPQFAQIQLEKVLKIQLMILVALILMRSFDRIEALVWISAASIGFYGFKGGIFTVLHGGVYRVQGPPGTFIGGNNELGLAMAMTVPLLYFMRSRVANPGLKTFMTVWVVLTAFAAIGTQSRGALLGMAAMGAFVWINSRNKFFTLVVLAVTATAIANFMPESWYERMGTIKTHDEDKSAQGRVNAWWTSFHLANDRLLGGGFDCWWPPTFAMYAPNPDDAREVHSVVFEVLGEHGYIGLAIFTALGVFTWFSAGWTARRARRMPDIAWVADMMRMVQVSMVAYATAGQFLGLAYFDYYYTLIVIVVATRALVQRRLQGGMPDTEWQQVQPAGLFAGGRLPNFRRLLTGKSP